MLPRARRALFVPLLLAMPCLGGCLESIVFYGRSPDRRHLAEIVEGPGGQWVRVDGREGKSYRGIGVESLAYCPDGRKIAYAAEQKAGWVVVTQPTLGPRAGVPLGDPASPRRVWEGIGEIVWSPDGEHLAYAAERAGWRVVRDGREGPVFEALLAHSLSWSPDGRRLAYVGQRGESRFVVDGDRVGHGYDGIAGLTFSADGARLGYVARRGESVELVIEGVAGKPHPAISDFALSPRGGRFAYVALDEAEPLAFSGPRGGSRRLRWFTVVDGVFGSRYDRIASLAFDPTGAHLAYAARRDSAEFVVVDGVEGEALEGIVTASLSFSPDGKHLVYGERTGGRARVVFDGVAGPPFDSIARPVFAPAGERWAYVARRGALSLVVDNGREGRAYDWVGSLVYSPDGRRLGYLARRGGQGLVVHEPARTALDGAVEGSLVFSRDSGHWACLVTPSGAFGLYVAIDGVPRIRFDLEELTAAVARLPYSERLLSDHTDLVRRWVAAELELYLRR
jgi:WD40 repeat protein